MKRSSDTRIRREVVGQMLDYAANATEHWRVDHMRERFAANCQRSGVDATTKLKEFLGDNVDPENFWEKANRNLQDRKLRLLFIADVIPRELQRIVEFLNEQMDHTVRSSSSLDNKGCGVLYQGSLAKQPRLRQSRGLNDARPLTKMSFLLICFSGHRKQLK